MSNPKEWFRRRPRGPLPIGPGDAEDPFIDDTVLDLGRSATMVGMNDARAGGAGRSMVPPPPPRDAGQRPPRTIESNAFTVRPEITMAAGSALATRPEPRPAPVHVPASVPATFAKPGAPIRSRAVPLARPVAYRSAVAKEPSHEMTKEPPREEVAMPLRADPRARLQPAKETNRGWFVGDAAAPPEPDKRREIPSSPTRETGRDWIAAPPPRPASLGRPAAAPGAQPDASKTNGGLPGFTLAAPGIAWLRSRPPGDSGAANAALREAFTPTRPQHQVAQFSGRHAQMQRIICAIEEERAHVVLYGERGSGKTSLANIIAAQAEQAGYFVVKFACSSELSFDDIFRSFLRRIPATFLAGGIGATNRAGINNFDELLAPGEIGVAELIAIFTRLHDKHVILVIDEYDRVTSEDTKNKLAELIKNMSDASVPVTLLLIGVAEDVDALLGKHPSLQRTLVTIPLPLMTAAEIEAIILGGEQRSGLRFAPAVRQTIVELAQGLPYHAQLLCLFAARNAVRRHATDVEREDLCYAVLRAAEEAEGKIKEAYALAVASSQGGTAFKDVLFAAAHCRSDEFGTFAVADVAQEAANHGISLSALALQFPLKKLTESGRGAMLRRITGLDGLRYQFVNQMLRHHILVRQAAERGLV